MSDDMSTLKTTKTNRIVFYLIIVVSVLAAPILILNIISAFYGEPVVIYNDTDEKIEIEPIVTSGADNQRSKFTPRLVITPGESGHFLYDWDDSRFWGEVMLDKGGEQSQYCNGSQRDLKDPIVVWSGWPIPFFPHDEKQALFWSGFTPCKSGMKKY